MARGNCCDICTPPPDSCILGACCYDDGDNVDITCEDNVTESYCLTKANSVFNARGVCGEKITCDSYYEPKIQQLGPYSYIVIKSDGSVVTWKTISEEDDPQGSSAVEKTEESFMLSDEDALRIQPTPFGDNGATKIYTDGYGFCAVRKKDGSFVVWGKYIDSSEATVIEEGIKNAKKIIFSRNTGCALKEDGTLFTFNIDYDKRDSRFNAGWLIPENLAPLLADPDNPVVDIFVDSEYRASALKFCALLKDGNAYIWGIGNTYSSNGNGSHAYDLSRGGTISVLDSSQILTHNAAGRAYSSTFDVNNDGIVNVSDALAIINYVGLYGNSSDAFTEGVQIPIRNVSGVFAGASAFSFIKNDGSFYTTKNPGSKQSQLTNVSGLFFTRSAICALKHDGRVVAWGDPRYGGFIDPTTQEIMDLDEIDTIVSNERAFCATGGDRPFYDGSTRVDNLFTWGSSSYGGDKSFVYRGREDPHEDTRWDGKFEPNSVVAIRRGFIFKKSLAYWGGYGDLHSLDPYKVTRENISGNTTLESRFSDFIFNQGGYGYWKIESNGSAVAALNERPERYSFREDAFVPADSGKVISFGDFKKGGYGTTDRYDGIDRKFTPVRRFSLECLVSNENSFAGFSIDGGIVCWGNQEYTDGCISADMDVEYIEAATNRNNTTGITQRFIDKQLKKIGANVNLHGDLITAGYEGCTSSSTQKDFCKTEDNLRVDCNPHTGKCDYGLGDFYPFIKVDNCKQCEEIANNRSYSIPSTNIHRFSRDGVLVPNFEPSESFTEVTCFSESSSCGVIPGGSRVITNGADSFAATKSECENGFEYRAPIFGGFLTRTLKGVAVSGDETYYSKFPTPITGEDVGPGPSGSCCFGLICEEGYNEYKHRPHLEHWDQCKDFKICYEVLTEKQCYDQKFTLRAGGAGDLPFIKTRGVNDIAKITYKTYHDFVPDVNCVDRTGEEGCQP